MVDEHVERQAGFLDRGVPAADYLQALVEHVFQQVAFRLQRLVERAVETRLVAVGLPAALPHLRQEDLERGGQGRPGVGQQVIGDDLGQAVLDRKTVLPLEPARPRGPRITSMIPRRSSGFRNTLARGSFASASRRSTPPATPCGTPAPACPEAESRGCPARPQRREELVQLAEVGPGRGE